MTRRKPIKTYLREEQIEILDRVASLTGEDRSGTLRNALMNYAKDIGVLNERVLRALEARQK